MRNYCYSKGLSSIPRRFILTPHVIKRLKQRGVSFPEDTTKLRVVSKTEMNSKIFNSTIPKFTLNYKRNMIVVYWSGHDSKL